MPVMFPGINSTLMDFPDLAVASFCLPVHAARSRLRVHNLTGTSPRKLEQDPKLWSDFLHTHKKPWLDLGEWKESQAVSHVFAC